MSLMGLDEEGVLGCTGCADQPENPAVFSKSCGGGSQSAAHPLIHISGKALVLMQMAHTGLSKELQLNTCFVSEKRYRSFGKINLYSAEESVFLMRKDIFKCICKLQMCIEVVLVFLA